MKKIVMMLLMLAIVLSAGFFSYQGISMHMQVDDEEATFHQLQTEYFSLAKAERDDDAYSFGSGDEEMMLHFYIL